MTDKKAAEVILLPEGRLINHSLFVKDQFNDKAKPTYKVELAFEKGALDDFYNKCLDAAVAKWGKGADEDENLIIPIKDGDKLAAKRAKAGKPGDAYAGLEIIRANTAFNKNGEDGPGGVAVYDMDVSEVGAANQGVVYQGSYGQAAVTIGTYEDSDGNNAITIYLSAYQKTADGERLVAQKDHSTLFKATGRVSAPAPEEGAGEAGAATEGGRRRRAG